MPSTTGTSSTWTLRFKHGKTTVLLHVDPLQKFSSLKDDLHTALQETTLHHPDTHVAIPLPESSGDYQFGVPVNASDPHRGFTLGAWEVAGEDEDGDKDVKGKGKAKGKKADSADCPKGAGLRDGAVLAFRWRGDGTGWEEEEEDEEMEGARIRKGDMWGVILASFEDGYGVENEGDLGGGVRGDGD